MRSGKLVLSVCCFVLLSNVLAVSGDALFLTKYLNDPQQGRALSKVDIGWKYPSYSGYFTVDEAAFANMFFWFFPAQDGNTSAPVLLWLQGGPGGSSMFGLFSENGPFSVSDDAEHLIPRKINWNEHYNLIYIDNPVGTGWSFTSSDSGFVTDEIEVGYDLYSALSQFFTIFDNYQPNDFYVTGESYAGKYVPAVAHRIHEENKKYSPSSPKFINMKGISIGDGAIDPITQFTDYSSLLFYIGFIDEHEAGVFRTYEEKIIEHIASEQWEDAFHAWDLMLNGDFVFPTYYFNVTGVTDYFNLLNPFYPENPYPKYLTREDTRKGIHVGGYGFADYNATVEKYLIKDWMKSVRKWMPELMDNYKVLIYNGAVDIILGPPAAEKVIRGIEWKHQEEYLRAEKAVWKITPNDKRVAGYVRSVRNFRQVVVREAGHMVPLDQPERAYDMITRFINDVPF
eukprot:TRINITY_DN3741_c0_g1_i1.p1 TRINITY_DN3741_c0_g1~~TRINITY_DN3741_c0_g1_i1.p1  ORF type:complete len:455 (-),score=75.13 TRINITY_DN3741_c0_g1_i1:33-1397(-)